MNVVDALAGALVAENVTCAFNVPDEVTIHLVQALSEHGVRVVRPRHEQNAVLMADGYSRISDEPGVCIVGPGPAMAHTGTGLVTAVRHRSQMMVLAGRAPAVRGNIKEFDTGRYAEAMGARFLRIRNAASLAADVREAFRLVRQRRGPVVVEFPPLDELVAEVPDSWEYTPSLPITPTALEIDPSSPAIEDIAAALANAQRPIIVAGAGAVTSGAKDEILELAERMDALVATSIQARDLFRGSVRNIGIIGSLSLEGTADVLSQADCIVAVGIGLNYYQTGGGHLAPGARLIHIDNDIGNVHQFSPAEQVVIGDGRAVIRAVNRCLAGADLSQSTYWSTEAAASKIGAAQTPPPPNVAGPGELMPVSQLLAELDALLPDDRVVVQDCGLFGFFALDQFSVRSPRSWVWTLDFGSIGLALPMAVGAALARPDSHCVVLCGDGGMMMNIQEIETIVREAIPMTVVICNDRAFGAEVRFLQQFGKPVDFAVFGDVDFAAVARAFGAEAITVRSIDDLVTAKELLDGRSEPLIIDAKVTEEESHPKFRKR